MKVRRVPIAQPISPIQKTIFISINISDKAISRYEHTSRVIQITIGGALFRLTLSRMKLNTLFRKTMRITMALRIKPAPTEFPVPWSSTHRGNFSRIAQIGKAQDISTDAILKHQ
jgi:hypothetical protein